MSNSENVNRRPSRFSFTAPTINDTENGAGLQSSDPESGVNMGEKWSSGGPNGRGADVGYKGTGGYVQHVTTAGGHPLDSSQPAFPIYHRKFGNPAPLGLLAFGGTTFVLSMYNVQARGVAIPNVILGLAMGYGGLVQIIAGIQEWASGNSFGATAFSSYGGFWLSFAVLYIPQFQVAEAYGTSTAEFHNAVGIYLSSWGVITFIFFLATFRSSFCLSALFFFLDVTFWLLTAGELSGSVNCAKAGGAFGILTAAIAGYTALAGLLTKDTSHFQIPVGTLSRGDE